MGDGSSEECSCCMLRWPSSELLITAPGTKCHRVFIEEDPANDRVSSDKRLYRLSKESRMEL